MRSETERRRSKALGGGEESSCSKDWRAVVTPGIDEASTKAAAAETREADPSSELALSASSG